MDLAEFVDQFDTKEKLSAFINDFEKAGKTINQQAHFIVNSDAAFKQFKANLIVYPIIKTSNSDINI